MTFDLVFKLVAEKKTLLKDKCDPNESVAFLNDTIPEYHPPKEIIDKQVKTISAKRRRYAKLEVAMGDKDLISRIIRIECIDSAVGALTPEQLGNETICSKLGYDPTINYATVYFSTSQTSVVDKVDDKLVPQNDSGNQEQRQQQQSQQEQEQQPSPSQGNTSQSGAPGTAVKDDESSQQQQQQQKSQVVEGLAAVGQGFMQGITKMAPLFNAGVKFTASAVRPMCRMSVGASACSPTTSASTAVAATSVDLMTTFKSYLASLDFQKLAANTGIAAIIAAVTSGATGALDALINNIDKKKHKGIYYALNAVRWGTTIAVSVAGIVVAIVAFTAGTPIAWGPLIATAVICGIVSVLGYQVSYHVCNLIFSTDMIKNCIDMLCTAIENIPNRIWWLMTYLYKKATGLFTTTPAEEPEVQQPQQVAPAPAIVPLQAAPPLAPVQPPPVTPAPTAVPQLQLQQQPQDANLLADTAITIDVEAAAQPASIEAGYLRIGLCQSCNNNTTANYALCHDVPATNSQEEGNTKVNVIAHPALCSTCFINQKNYHEQNIATSLGFKCICNVYSLNVVKLADMDCDEAVDAGLLYTGTCVTVKPDYMCDKTADSFIEKPNRRGEAEAQFDRCYDCVQQDGITNRYKKLVPL